MIIRKLKNDSELRACLEISKVVADDPLLPYDGSFFWNNLMKMKMEGVEFRVILHNNKIIAWGNFKVQAPYAHSKSKEASLLYFHTSESGYLAAKALMLIQKEVVAFGIAKRVIKCVATSITYKQEGFYRVLEKCGWIRKGCVMVYPLAIDNCSSTRLASRSVQGGTPDRPRVVQNGTALPRAHDVSG